MGDVSCKLQAIKYLERLPPAGEGEPSLFFNIGLAYEVAGRLEEALNSYQKAIRFELQIR